MASFLLARLTLLASGGNAVCDGLDGWTVMERDRDRERGRKRDRACRAERSGERWRARRSEGRKEEEENNPSRSLTFFPSTFERRHRSNTFGLFFSPPLSASLTLFAPAIDARESQLALDEETARKKNETSTPEGTKRISSVGRFERPDRTKSERRKKERGRSRGGKTKKLSSLPHRSIAKALHLAVLSHLPLPLSRSSDPQ
jgi:hypothetical protein